MDKREYRLEKAKIAAQTQREAMESFKELLKNPIVELGAGALLMSYLYAPRPTDSFFGGFAKGFQSSLFGAGMVTVITAQQLSGALPYLTGAAPQAMIGGLLK